MSRFAFSVKWGWLGEAKVSCILHHWSWLTVGQGLLSLQQVRVAGGMLWFLLFLLCHLFSFLPSPSLSSPLLSLFSLSLGDDTKWPKRVDVSLYPNSINQSINQSLWSMHVYIECRLPQILWVTFLLANLADDKLMIFIIFHFSQKIGFDISQEDNMHEKPKPTSGRNMINISKCGFLKLFSAC